MRKFVSMFALIAVLSLMLVLSPHSGLTTTSAATQPVLDKELNVYNWADYIDEDLLKEYEAKFGVKINYDNYASNEELLTKLQAGATGYDVIFPSDYMVARMINLSLVAKLDKSNIPNITNLDPFNLDNWYDPNNDYCMPYNWGTTGIAYLSTLKKPPTSWAALFDPAQAEYYSKNGGINLLDDQREAMGAALKYLGYSVNDTDPAHVQQARDTIIKILPLIHSFNSSDYQDTLLIPREVSISQAWNGDVAKASRETAKDAATKGQWKFLIPKEGGVRWQDSVCVTASTTRKATAEHFINYLLDPKSAARTSNVTGYVSANKNARPFTDADILSFAPPAKILEKLEWIKPLDDEATKLYDQTWTEIRASQ